MIILILVVALFSVGCSSKVWAPIPSEAAAGAGEAKLMCQQYADDTCGARLSCRRKAMGQCMGDRGWL